jgi:ankyrin repeat protein
VLWILPYISFVTYQHPSLRVQESALLFQFRSSATATTNWLAQGMMVMSLPQQDHIRVAVRRDLSSRVRSTDHGFGWKCDRLRRRRRRSAAMFRQKGSSSAPNLLLLSSAPVPAPSGADPSVVAFAHVATAAPRERRKENHSRIDDDEASTSSTAAVPVAAATLPLLMSDDDEVGADEKKDKVVVEDTRPHEQRAPGPRPARRLNHAFRHLYRSGSSRNSRIAGKEGDDEEDEAEDAARAEHDDDGAESFLLAQGFTAVEIESLRERFPPLLELSVEGHIAPKLRFMRRTLHLHLHNQTERSWIPPELFGIKLEAVLAPRHAFLVHAGLPHGRDLLVMPSSSSSSSGRRPVALLLHDFVRNCRQSSHRFAAFCQSLQFRDDRRMRNNLTTASVSASSGHPPLYPIITSKHIEAFQFVFSRGLLAAARNDLVQPPSSSSTSPEDKKKKWQPLEVVNRLDSAELSTLLIQHGANPLERDYRGVTLLHWACGCGNLETARVLAQYHWPVHTCETQRDGAGCLHWAAAGATPREFGVGGHADVCRFLMEQVHAQERAASRSSDLHQERNQQQPPGSGVLFSPITLREYINRPTKDGNTPLMWAAWSGSIDTVKLLVRNRADPNSRNRNGCTVAHWAASGGEVEVCRYLHEIAGVDFSLPNHAGNTPLSHAVAFGRADVVAWLRQEVLLPRGGGNDATLVARSLARDFVTWTDGDHPDRNRVLQLLDEWSDHKEATTRSPAGDVNQLGDEDIQLW